ncbi:hypothetical protein [Actinotalea sp. K2]|uniref:hypothetical protein n=1 Tax=Actinotalea sp. K2 TaxID=2939438 RepID=UPI002017843A|nr:hypothetical protein [Actinotalea sp. K2]MCL3859566.1 hypothetical protein [Actinotalea sp. K2]
MVVAGGVALAGCGNEAPAPTETMTVIQTASPTAAETPDLWTAVDPSALPRDVPILVERILRAELNSDGSSWRVMLQLNDAGADGYPLAVAALTAAGFAVDQEETDPTRPAWNYAELRSDDFQVTLDVSNETGEGFYADYVITARQ